MTYFNLNLERKPAKNKLNYLAQKFVHLHNHTDYSLLSATTKIDELIKLTSKYKMSALGITDYGNMMGAFSFLNYIETYNKNILNTLYKPIKGIIGCEFFLSENFFKNKFCKQVLLAKNKTGYYNLVKICSEAYLNGDTTGYPKIDKKLILRYKNDLIAISGDLSAEIPYILINYGKKKAENHFRWWHDQFKDDFYVELLRHGLYHQTYVNKNLLQFSKKFGVKYIPQNNTFYLEKKDAIAYDILLCIRDGKKKYFSLKNRFGFSNQEFYFKTQDQMVSSFSDIPESFYYLEELIKKINIFSLKRDILLPKFSIPREFKKSLDLKDGVTRGENSYLYHLAFQGAFSRYKGISQYIKDKLNFELYSIIYTGYPGYFLIVENFVSEAKRIGITIGPGRGSVAGSLISYCLGITQIDPIRYNLLFERFLNPDRVSLPDIDLDLDDRGRESIIKWVANRYGAKQVAKIITYGRMAARSSIRDTARVLDLALINADRLAKMVPEGVSISEIISENVYQLKKKIHSHDFENVLKLFKLAHNNSLEGQVLRQASVIEESLKTTGVHACGIIITPSSITNYTPILISKESDLLITQFDNNVVENAGLLKIDFLGLKTLSIINDTLILIENKYGKKLITKKISLKNLKSYRVFQKGETLAIFQYESIGMQRFLQNLKPDTFEDLIAMNALYRPGPIHYIPNFIARKHGKEAIIYALPEMKKILKSTYGITVYQEQVMLLAQKLAGFGKNQADILRKAMGKKQRDILDKMKNKFLYGAIKNGYPTYILENIWKDWESFASYAFNKSHSTCYAYLAFQTAYLKAHYPSEYMAVVLSNHIHNIKDISLYILETVRLGLHVVGPDINNSHFFFIVNEQGDIRFGLKAIKGLGEGIVDSFIRDRSINGPYLSIFNLINRIDLRINNKKSLEILVLAGAFDSFSGIHRGQFFNRKKKNNMIEKIIFSSEEKEKNIISYLDFLNCYPWSRVVKLLKEKQILGLYISLHPLDNYKFEIKAIHGIPLFFLNGNDIPYQSVITYYGIIIKYEKKTSIKDGKKYVFFTLEDYQSTKDFILFDEEYIKYFHLITTNNFLALKIAIDIIDNRIVHIKYLHITHLSEVFHQIINEFHLEIDLSKFNYNIIDYIEGCISKFEGKEKLKIFFWDKKVNFYISSREYKVRFEKKLFIYLYKIQGLNLYLK